MISKQGDDGISQVPSTYILLLNLEDIPPVEPQNSSQRLIELLKLGHLRNSSLQRENQRSLLAKLQHHVSLLLASSMQ
jgi:hypothetical protein